MVVATESLSSLNAEQLRELARDLIAQVARQDAQITQLARQIALRNPEAPHDTGREPHADGETS